MQIDFGRSPQADIERKAHMDRVEALSDREYAVKPKWFYENTRGTAESKSATKKSHKMRKSVEKSTDFDILIPKTIFFSIILYLSLKVAFVLR